MSKSVEELFRNAPEDATHYAKYCHYKVIGDTWMVYISDNEWAKSDSMYNGQIKPSDIIQRPQHKPWSGLEDGLPPINTVCEALKRLDDIWLKVKIIDHQGTVDTAACRVVGDDRLFWAQDFRAAKTPEQLAAEKRETAIRELMDIAQVDCRVTAARLVDAGFKREVV